MWRTASTVAVTRRFASSSAPVCAFFSVAYTVRNIASDLRLMALLLSHFRACPALSTLYLKACVLILSTQHAVYDTAGAAADTAVAKTKWLLATASAKTVGAASADLWVLVWGRDRGNARHSGGGHGGMRRCRYDGYCCGRSGYVASVIGNRSGKSCGWDRSPNQGQGHDCHCGHGSCGGSLLILNSD